MARARTDRKDSSPPDKSAFHIAFQQRLLEMVEAHAADIPIRWTSYVPAVLRGYQTGQPTIVRPKPGTFRALARGKKEQAFRITRLWGQYPPETVDWIDALCDRAGGFNRGHVVTLFLLDWFNINPFPAVLSLDGSAPDTRGDEEIPANTSAENRAKTNLTCQSRFLELVNQAGDPAPEQQYIRSVMASYATAKTQATRPRKGTFSPLTKAHPGREFETQTVGLYCHPDLLDWIDGLGNRAGGFNRSHTMLYLLLDWLHINPFSNHLLGA